MGAEFVNQAVPPLRIAKRQQTFREQLDTHGRTFILGKFLGEERGNPVTPEQGAARRARAGLRQEVILLASQHAQSYPMCKASVEAARIGPRSHSISSLEPV
jgi:hypothetical protein